MLGQLFLLRELIPVSQNLTRLAGAGLDALRAMETGHRLTAGARARQLAAIDDAAKPRAELLIMIAPGVRALVEAAGTRK